MAETKHTCDNCSLFEADWGGLCGVCLDEMDDQEVDDHLIAGIALEEEITNELVNREIERELG